MGRIRWKLSVMIFWLWHKVAPSGPLKLAIVRAMNDALEPFTITAGTLARNWVENMGARGASCRRIFADGIAPKPFLTVYEQCGFEDDAS